MQTVVLLALWTRAWMHERMRARRQVLSMWHLKRLGGIVTAEGARNAANIPDGAGMNDGAEDAERERE